MGDKDHSLISEALTETSKNPDNSTNHEPEKNNDQDVNLGSSEQSETDEKKSPTNKDGKKRKSLTKKQKGLMLAALLVFGVYEGFIKDRNPNKNADMGTRTAEQTELESDASQVEPLTVTDDANTVAINAMEAFANTEIVKKEESPDSNIDLSVVEVVQPNIEEKVENKEFAEFLNEMVDLEDTEVTTEQQGVEMGSVVSESDIKELKIEMGNMRKELDALISLYHESQQLNKSKIAKLELEISKKQYDLSFEKDRPIITKLLISKPTVNCEGCVAHAQWRYQGQLIQKTEGQKWLAFDIRIKDDRLILESESGSYDYWSTKNSF